MKQQFHIVPVIARLFPFQIPEPQNNGGVIFRPLSDPDLQVIHAPCLVLMMSFVTYIFPFSGTQLMPAYEFTALFVVQLDMSVILKKPYNGVPIFIGAGGHAVVVGPVPYRIVLADMILFRLVFGGHRFSIVWQQIFPFNLKFLSRNQACGSMYLAVSCFFQPLQDLGVKDFQAVKW